MRLAADFHQLHGFCPAGDDAAQRESGWLVALERAVEHLAVNEATFVIDLDLVVSGRAGARALTGGLDDQAAGGLGGALFCGCLSQIGRTSRLFFFGGCSNALRLQFLQLGDILFEVVGCGLVLRAIGQTGFDQLEFFAGQVEVLDAAAEHDAQVIERFVVFALGRLLRRIGTAGEDDE